MTTTTITRDEAIIRIKAALKKRSGKSWSVTGGRGTAWGWIGIDAPPKRRTWQYLPDGTEVDSPTEEFGHMSPADRAELATLLGLETVHYQGENIPASSEYRQEYVDRAEGREPSVEGTCYWD